MEALAATFVLGLGSAASPCLLPLYPGFIAYLAAAPGRPAGRLTAALLGVAVLAGLVTTMAVLGVTFSLLAIPLGDLLRWSLPISTIVLVVLGVLLLAGVNPFSRMATTRLPAVRNPLAQAYVYGLLAGPVAMPCAGPFFVAMLAISIGLADTALRLGSFLVYGLGFGLPLVALAAIGAVRGRAVARLLARHHVAISRVAGALIIVTALYQLVLLG